MKQANVQEIRKQREQMIHSKGGDPDEFDVINDEEVRKAMPPFEDEENEDEKLRQFVRAYYSLLPKEIITLCQIYIEQNFSTK